MIPACGRDLVIMTFFFQAEDGIRDGHVTGVQTCALPIFFTANENFAVGRNLDVDAGDRLANRSFACAERMIRSEERRVGKECRYRWSPSQYKKNNLLRDWYETRRDRHEPRMLGCRPRCTR